jgi:uncharacterized membrane protein YkoI
LLLPLIPQELNMLPLHSRLKYGKFFIHGLALCLLLASSFATHANPGDSRESREHREPRAQSERREPERRQEQPRARISASQAAAMVEQRYGGKVMNVQARQGNSGVIYSVKILQSSGHMRTVNVDGQSGAILN